MTDGAPGSDGYPDSRMFVVAKYSADADAVQHSGSLHKIIEDSPDGTGTTFHWTRFVQAGEAGAQDGAGFAQVDNLAFDQAGDLRAVNDISSELYNGLSTGLTPTQQVIDHTLTGITPNIAGVFGNSMLFCVPLSGPDAGHIVPIATGPNRCEFTGINFAGDTLIMSVQHPGEDSADRHGQLRQPQHRVAQAGWQPLQPDAHDVARQQLAEQRRGNPRRPRPGPR